VTQFEFLRPHSRTGAVKLADVQKVVGALRRGGLAVLPTETGYMLAVDAYSIPAIRRAFEVKGRARANVMHVACSSLQMAESVGVINRRALRILGEFTPGPVSVIVEKKPSLPDELVTLNGTVGIRIPDHFGTLQVVEEFGRPLTATSLNSSGEPGGLVDRSALDRLGWPPDEVVYVLEDAAAAYCDSPSTLVRVTAPVVEILRAGPIGEPDIQKAVSSLDYIDAVDEGVAR
jgi:L-threonylcarbamoyladenylate synthase